MCSELPLGSSWRDYIIIWGSRPEKLKKLNVPFTCNVRSRPPSLAKTEGRLLGHGEAGLRVSGTSLKVSDS